MAKDGGKKGSGNRDLTVRVKSARGRKNSSTRWLQRQLNDPYVSQAKLDGYRSRAAYKLIEMDDKYQFLTKGKRVLDLGAAPGGWTQVALQRLDAENHDQSMVLATDILEMPPVAGSQFIQLDFTQEDAPDIITQALGGKVDVVMSDMAPNTTGHSSTDHIRIILLCEMAYDFAKDVLNKGGIFICKVRQGGTEAELLNDMKIKFDKVVHMKPDSSRKQSSESYVLAIGFRG
jgi:23S rRNA (uridine2552-2'-O)-methyltransferase